ncbi:MAG TPA: ATP-binding cassette domain-containing protein [Bacteroidales bacterium]|jgi:phospholipid/cholesterol/gamma-HCH transport system ATP-binding protein|nr:ATP-binding cassette domain-containing protein [Bacteroidales bacterium]MDI9573889.1 ATP-binding cassette domain-containing protein [Bacteroidota bacterium]MBP9511661.1 ATP-binding cassette domain-containing protein [Bacteroidales bacterium]MBP9587983.1 ATP-binding cassette domain-containing protein [Bacteroidales bacterium]HOE59174.1 ATP-binding cassette domain-containing protein [Bacteroidales bacterium]
MITVSHISKTFGKTKVLSDISAQFETGRVHQVIGQSGSGKTVLMKCLVGLLEVDEGEVLYDGRNFSQMTANQRKEIRKEMGMLFQGGALFDSMNVAENVAFPMLMHSNLTTAEMKKRVDFCLERVNLAHSHKLIPSELSGGMTKRVAIARAIALNPHYLFCDEPNSGLDPQTANMIDNLIAEITHEYNMITIVNTHDMNSVLEIGEEVNFIYKGKLWWKGDRNSILNSNNAELNQFVFATGLMRRLKPCQ